MALSGEIHSPITRVLIHYISSKGVDKTTFCKLAGITTGLLEEPEAKFPFAVLNLAWVKASELAEDPLIGLHVGEFLDLNALGVVGYLLQSSKTLGEAFETASRYTTLTGGVIDLSLRFEENRWKLIFGLQQSLPDTTSFAIRQLKDAAISITLKTFNKLTNQAVHPLKISFSSPRPSAIAEYERIFGIRPFFDQDEDALFYDSSVYGLPVIYSNPTLYALFEKHATAMLEMLKKRADMSSKAKMMMMRHLRDKQFSLETVASELNMSPRTLQRRLAEEGTSFNILLDEVRRELAEDYLIRLGMSVSDTTFLLGLSQPSAFVRSFKRWTGVSPKEYQKTHRK